MMYTELVNATLLSVDPTVPEDVREKAAVFLNKFLNSPECFRVSVEIFDRGSGEFMPITRMFCLTAIGRYIEQSFNNFDLSEWNNFQEKLWEWYEGSIRDQHYIRNKLIKILIVLFGNLCHNDVPEFFRRLVTIYKTKSNTQEDYYIKTEMFLNVCKTLNEELITALPPDQNRDFLDRSNEIKDIMRENVLVALTSEWIDILNNCYGNDAYKLVNLCLETFSGYITWMPIKLSSDRVFIQRLYQYAEIESTLIPSIECITQIISKKMPPIDRLVLIQSLDTMPVLDKLVRLSGSTDAGVKIAHLINAIGMAFCEGWRSEKSTVIEKEECIKQLEQLCVYTRKVLLDCVEDEVTVILQVYLNAHISIISTICKGFNTAAQANTYLSQLAEILHMVIFAMKYSTDYVYSECDVCDDDFPYTKKRMILKKLFNAIGSIIPDLQISYIFEVVEQTLKSPEPSKLSWADIELSLFLISLTRDIVKKPGKSAQAKDIYATADQYVTNFHKVRAMVECALEFGKVLRRNELVIISYLQVLYKHYQYFEVHEDLIPELLEYIFSKRDTVYLFQSTRARGQYVLKHLIRNLKSQLSSYVEAIIMAFKSCLCDVLNALPTEEEQKELKVNPRNHSPASVSMFEAVGTLILLSEMPESKRFELLKDIIKPVIDRITEIMHTGFYMNKDAPGYMMYICKLNHIIIALGNICKDFSVSDSSSKKAKEFDHANPYIEIFAPVLDTIVGVLNILVDNFYIRTASVFTFRRMVDCSGEHTVRCTLMLLNNGILINMSAPEMSDILHLFVQITAKLKIDDEDIVKVLCYVLDKLRSLSFQDDELGTDYRSDMIDLRRNYVNLIFHILQLKNAYNILIFLNNVGYLSAITNSLISFCYDNDYLTQKGSLSSVVKLINIWGKGELGSRYEEHAASARNYDPANHSSSSPEGDFMKDFKAKSEGGTSSSLPGFDSFLLEKVVPMLFGVLESSNLKAGDNHTRTIVAEITKAHFEILKLEGYKYPYYLGKVFFQSADVPSPYASNLLTVLTSNDQKACNNLLSSYAANMSSKTHR